MDDPQRTLQLNFDGTKGRVDNNARTVGRRLEAEREERWEPHGCVGSKGLPRGLVPGDATPERTSRPGGRCCEAGAPAIGHGREHHLDELGTRRIHGDAELLPHERTRQPRVGAGQEGVTRPAVPLRRR